VRDQISDRRRKRTHGGERQERRREREEEKRLREADKREHRGDRDDERAGQQIASQGRDGVEHADEKRHGVRSAILISPVLPPEVAGERLALLDVGGVLGRTNELIDFLDRFLGNRGRPTHVAAYGAAVRHLDGYTAERQHRRETPDRVGAAAEAEEVDAVAGFVDPQDPGVAVDDVGGDAEPGRLARDVVQPTPCPRNKERALRRLRTQPGVVDCDLLGGVDAAVGTAAGRPKELVDVGAVLVGRQAAGLAGTVRKDQNVLRHETPVAFAAIEGAAGSGDRKCLSPAMPVPRTKKSLHRSIQNFRRPMRTTITIQINQTVALVKVGVIESSN
jgi:hypothetical protein